MNKSQKRSFDMPAELYEYVMKYAVDNKLYKFGLALMEIIKEHKAENCK